MFLAIAHYTVADGNESAVLALVAELESASRAEPGCLAFDAYLKVGSARRVVLIERYRSEADFALHRETEHFARLVLAQIVPLLEERSVESWELPD
ncbi:putative quinol monooxygenase [Lacisediminihabitans profunda]|uniref:Antibiotic biosynthesis monooxygenase n=1 Tax=Lacisediminihabitans profunda TaxID=2594790 RepID=A0A5C8UTP4_9MICO|nr:putative quinol monooxygenase [Lacisediminihabitans profunda]TXN31964.1 antibiotic biosynthesis monooxygenase [Lacisediminihabitans profunda]